MGTGPLFAAEPREPAKHLDDVVAILTLLAGNARRLQRFEWLRSMRSCAGAARGM